MGSTCGGRLGFHLEEVLSGHFRQYMVCYRLLVSMTQVDNPYSHKRSSLTVKCCSGPFQRLF